MSSSTLMLKYRPQQFSEVSGQGVVTEILQNMFDKGEYAPSYLFYGTRGTGKTSTARIVAKCLNCEKGITGSPCDSCSSCVSIKEGLNTDVYEIDGASNRGIADIRNIQEIVRFLPNNRFKALIIDEAHMLTREAFNAFLKTLEEPPDGVVFILATTDFQALPSTVVSRCQKFLFKPIDVNTIRSQIGLIGQTEQIAVSNELITIIAKYANGSMRDALTILEQLKYLGREAEATDIVHLLGIVPKKKTANLIEAIGKANIENIVQALNTMADDGEDFKRVTADLQKQSRNILVYKSSDNPKKALGIHSGKYIDLLGYLGDLFTSSQLLVLITCINTAYTTMQYGADLRIALEIAIFRYLESVKGN